MPNAVKKHPIPKKLRLLILLAAVVLAAALAAVLLLAGESHGIPEINVRGKTYACGAPLGMTEEQHFDLYVDLMENCDAEILTRTVDGVEIIRAYGLRKDWPVSMLNPTDSIDILRKEWLDSKSNRIASIGGLRLGDSEAKLLRKYPKASVGGLKVAVGPYIPDETWEDFTVYYHDGQPYSPTEYDALLQSVPESEADTIRLHTYALIVLTAQDEIICINFGDCTLIQSLTQIVEGTSPNC